jgi:hypothetical protein
MDTKELLVWTRDLLENLEMRPGEPGFSGYTVHLNLLDAVREWLAREEKDSV